MCWGWSVCLDRVVGLVGLQAVVELAEHAVVEVAQGCGVAVTVVAASQVVRAGGPWQPAAMNAQTNPTAARRLFFTCRWVMRMLRPEALVTGADPANAFNARASANRVRSSPISASRRAPVRSASRRTR